MTPDWLLQATEGSETGELVRATDWSRTVLGAPEDWPPALRSAVAVCFGTRFPVLVTWGPELTMIYNDGYRLLAGDKHPAAMGAPTSVVWSEIWDDIAPVFRGVLATGRPSWQVDQLLMMRRAGFLEEAFFSYSYSALRDEAGAVVGVLDIAYETTESVVDRRRLEFVTGLAATLTDLGGGVDELAAAVVSALEESADIRSGGLYLWTEAEAPEQIGVTGAPLPLTVTRDVLAAVARTLTAVRIGSCLVAPLAGTRDARAAGVVVLEGSPRRPFDAGHSRFLDLVAVTIGTALTSTLRHTREVRELRVVSDALQQAMLPDLPAVPGLEARYRPADRTLAVGGDWYDVVELRDGRLALVVGDCVGHGLRSAAVMGQLRAAARAIVLEDGDAAGTLAALDRFAETLPGAECTTVFCAVLDPAAGRLAYSSAGHLPPLLRSADGAAAWLDQAGGAPLAVHRGERPQASRELLPGDTVVLFTDGLVERRGESLSAGLERLAHTVEELEAEGRLSLDELLTRMLPDGAADDVAALVHRVAH